MAIQNVSITLSGHYPGGRPVFPKRFVTALGIPEVPYEVYGEPEPYRAVGLAIGNLALKDFGDPADRPEAHDDFEKAIQERLLHFAGWLARIPTDNMRRLRSDGLNVRVIVKLWIDGDQMDYHLPPALSTELGRLDLELYVLSNE